MNRPEDIELVERLLEKLKRGDAEIRLLVVTSSSDGIEWTIEAEQKR